MCRRSARRAGTTVPWCGMLGPRFRGWRCWRAPSRAPRRCRRSPLLTLPRRRRVVVVVVLPAVAAAVRRPLAAGSGWVRRPPRWRQPFVVLLLHQLPACRQALGGRPQVMQRAHPPGVTRSRHRRQRQVAVAAVAAAAVLVALAARWQTRWLGWRPACGLARVAGWWRLLEQEQRVGLARPSSARVPQVRRRPPCHRSWACRRVTWMCQPSCRRTACWRRRRCTTPRC